MATGTVISVRLPDEVLEALQKRAAIEKRNLSDIVRDMLVAGVTSSAPNAKALEELSEKTERILRLLEKAVKAGAGARYFAKLSASYGQDISDHLSNHPFEKDAKARLMEMCENKARELEDDYLTKPIEKL